MQITRKVWHETDTNEANEASEFMAPAAIFSCVLQNSKPSATFTDTDPKRYADSAIASAMETHERICGAHSESAVEQRHGKHVKATKEHT